MTLSELIPSAEVLIALEPDELGLRMLPLLAEWPHRHPNIDVQLRCLVPSGTRNATELLGQYPNEYREKIDWALREAWTWLEGQALLIPVDNSVRLSRRARKLAKRPDPHRVANVRLLPKGSLNPKIREDVWSLYLREKYDTAVFEAMKAVEVAVREAANLTADDIGKDLMRKAFHEIKGPLTDMATQKAEREARSHLFAGAISSYKNPHSHRYVALDDPEEAAEIIMLANHLLRIVDARRKANETK